MSFFFYNLVQWFENDIIRMLHDLPVVSSCISRQNENSLFSSYVILFVCVCVSGSRLCIYLRMGWHLVANEEAYLLLYLYIWWSILASISQTEWCSYTIIQFNWLFCSQRLFLHYVTPNHLFYTVSKAVLYFWRYLRLNTADIKKYFH